MANRNFPSQRIFGFHFLPVRLDAQVVIGSSGAVSSFTGLGIAAVTRLAQGQYRIQMQDNYAQFLGVQCSIQSPVTGSGIAGGSLSIGTVYQIVTLGNTTQAQWVAAGVPSGVTAAPGVVFKAATIGAGTGTSKVLGFSGVQSMEIIGNPNLMLKNSPFNANQGGYFHVQFVGPTDSATTTPIAVDPASGCVLNFQIMFNNSAVQ